MERDDASVWQDIHKYKEMLEKDSGSYCFAPLADLYRKLSLFDDAIDVARVGCERHPDYVGGHLALGRAYLGKGMQEEGRASLEKVATMTPGNVLAQKLLSRVYIEQGKDEAAEKTLRLILSLVPDDAESQSLLESLPKDPNQTAPGECQTLDAVLDEPVAEVPFALVDEEIIEDAELVEELADEDLLDEDDFIVSPAQGDNGVQAGDYDSMNPLATVTLAELYVSQGFMKRAFTIYRQLLDLDPGNTDLKKRLYELKFAIDEDTATARYSHGSSAEKPSEHHAAEHARDMVTPVNKPVALPTEIVVATLEKWLDTIQRRR